MRRKAILRLGRLRLRCDRGMLAAIAAVTLVAVAAVGVTLSLGQVLVPPGQVAAALFGYASPLNELVIRVLRLPRVLVALFVGASLGMSGAIFQSLSGNGLVSPDIIGINSGASAAVVAGVVVFGTGQPPPVIAWPGRWRPVRRSTCSRSAAPCSLRSGWC